jgi:alpha,alpha-trehalose phosphorylase
VIATHQEAAYELVEGPPITLRCHGDPVDLSSEHPVCTTDIPPLKRAEAPTQPAGRAPRPRGPQPQKRL